MRLDTKNERSKLNPRAAPYYARIRPGQFIGLRKLIDGTETWCARFRDEDGKQHYTTIGPVSESLEYEQAFDRSFEWFRQLGEGVTGKTDDGDVATVEKACREYLEERRRDKGSESAKFAEAFFERRVYGRQKASRKKAVKADPIARIPLAKLRKKHIEDWRTRRLASSPKPNRSTLNRELTDLRAALNLAVTNRLVSSAQTREWTSVKAFKNAERRRDLFLDRDQRRALLASAQGAVRDLVEAAMLTGARAGELTSARVRQFDARTESLTLNGKTGTRTIPVSAPAADLFKRLSRSKLPNAFLLTRDDGQPWDHSGWDDGVRSAAEKAKLPAGTCLYTLRHAFITQALLDGMSTLDVCKLVGTSLRMIERHYGHLVTEATRKRLAVVEIL